MLVCLAFVAWTVCHVQVAFSQASNALSPQEVAQQYLVANVKALGLTADDIREVMVTDKYQTKHNQVTHVWFMQRYQGIPVFNGLLGLHIAPNGKVYHLSHRFVPELASKVNTTLPSLGGDQALMMAMHHLGFTGFDQPSLKQKIDQRFLVFEGGAISKSDIPVSACFVPSPEGDVRLAWLLVIEQSNTSDMWSIRVDAQTGEILSKTNRTVYCNHEKNDNHQHTAGCLESNGNAATAPNIHETAKQSKAAGTLNAIETYNVFPFPAESPAHGPQTLLVNPANPTASPLGWHDVNGVPGAEYTYTRGNNVHAYDDRANNDEPPATPIPDAGPTLVFNYGFNPDAEPQSNIETAITNLFYVNNTVHDILYQYGFDEEAGNFQANNYQNGGEDSDYVLAEGLDGGGVDNANFATPPDGANGRMQMFVWDRRGGEVVTVNSPGAIAGSYAAGTCSWNASTMVTATGVTAQVVLVNDGSSNPTLGCGTPASLAGKIAMVDRGICQFGEKAKKAQNAGAIGCIICNFDESELAFASGTAGTTGTTVTIPVVGMKKSQCDLLKQYLNAGLNVSLKQPSTVGPDQLDGDFDNGIIAHEYGHGVSNRLTGGPSQADCLNNPEQMGEGWSDLMTLFFTHRPGDMATTNRGVGTYVIRQPNNGQGIRRYPYNQDITVNPLVFSDVAANAEVHALGEVWTAVVWDMYWALIDKYGYDADIYNGTGGNNRALQLVMDGMKLQPCNPGFIDGRDAILLANVINNNGEDTCLIQTVFARRGFGYLATQGTSANASDGVENFEPRPVCIKTIKIKKTCTSFVQAGDNVTFTISVRNDKDTDATNVVLNDELPQGLFYNAGSANENGTSAGNMVTWNIGTLPQGAIKTYTYTAKADPTKKSLLLFKDAMDNDNNWIAGDVEPTNDGSVAFNTQTIQKKEGTGAYFVNSSTTENDVFLWYAEPVTVSGNRPVMRFWYNSNTEAGSDAAFLEFSHDEGVTFPDFLDISKCLRNPYTKVQYGTFAIPFLYGFSGNSNGWKQAYLDLSQFSGQTLQFRYRFGTDDNTNGGPGIYFDDTQIIDMLNYDGQACITTAQGDNLCAKAPESGVIIDSDATIATDEPVNQFGVRLFPNPASQTLTIMPEFDLTDYVQLSIFSADGRVAFSRNYAQLLANNTQQLDISRLPAGFYTLQLLAPQGRSIQKFIKK